MKKLYRIILLLIVFIFLSTFNPNKFSLISKKNSEFFEVLVPYDYFNFGLKEDIKVEKGQAYLPDKPGLGIDLDWDFIDNSTFKKI